MTFSSVHVRVCADKIPHRNRIVYSDSKEKNPLHAHIRVNPQIGRHRNTIYRYAHHPSLDYVIHAYFTQSMHGDNEHVSAHV